MILDEFLNAQRSTTIVSSCLHFDLGTLTFSKNTSLFTEKKIDSH